jgi:hypothetical protein
VQLEPTTALGIHSGEYLCDRRALVVVEIFEFKYYPFFSSGTVTREPGCVSQVSCNACVNSP